jgi:hypothetical protein
MSLTETLASDKKLWGIFHTDRDYARLMGDPLRTVVEAPTKIAAEEAAASLGFSEPWAHPVKASEVRRAQWLPRITGQVIGRNSPVNHHAAFMFDYAKSIHRPNPHRH